MPPCATLVCYLSEGQAQAELLSLYLSPYLNPYRGCPRRPTAVRFAHRDQPGTCGSLRAESGMRYQTHQLVLETRASRSKPSP